MIARTIKAFTLWEFVKAHALTLVWIALIGAWMQTPWNPWK